MAAGFLLLALIADQAGFSICIFYNLTGLPCPGCGMTRAVHHILFADFVHSLQYHPFGLAVVAAGIVLILSFFIKPLEVFLVRNLAQLNRGILAGGVAVLIFGVIRAVVYALLPDSPEASAGGSSFFSFFSFWLVDFGPRLKDIL